MTDRPDLIENLSPEQRERAGKIAELNDAMRANITKTIPGHTAILMGDLSKEIAAIEPMIKRHLIQINIVASVANFGPFTVENDPYGERDFGSFEFSADGFNEENERIMWKIDYYDLTQEMHSPDPTDPAVTHRVLTIFYARDY